MSEPHINRNIDLPHLDPALFQRPDTQQLFAPQRAPHAPRFLLLYGSLRERSFSRLAAEEAARILRALGGETRMFNPSGLPLVDEFVVAKETDVQAITGELFEESLLVDV